MGRDAPGIAGLHERALAEGRRVCAGAAIFDDAGRVFSPRRAADAPSMPNTWDVVGGHLEPGESVLDGLRREVFEETGWTVTGEPRLVFVCDWELPAEPGDPRRELDFLVEVDGPLDAPRLAPDEHSTWRWIGRDDVACFDENAGADLGLVRRLVEAAFAARADAPPAPHATIFLEPVPARVQDWRTAWDPVMASQIAPHVTVAYPSDVGDLDDLIERVAAAVVDRPSFPLRLGPPAHGGDPDRGIWLPVVDLDGGWRALRDAIVGDAATDGIEPHVTLVHPRTSGLGPTAWPVLAVEAFDETVATTSVEVTAWRDGGWRTVSEHRLG